METPINRALFMRCEGTARVIAVYLLKGLCVLGAAVAGSLAVGIMVAIAWSVVGLFVEPLTADELMRLDGRDFFFDLRVVSHFFFFGWAFVFSGSIPVTRQRRHQAAVALVVIGISLLLLAVGDDVDDLPRSHLAWFLTPSTLGGLVALTWRWLRKGPIG